MGMDGRRRQPQPGQPVHDRIQPIEAAGVEGGAHEPPAIGGIAHARGGLRQGAEAGEPAGRARPRQPAGWAMQEAGALPGHGVFVAAAEVEGAAGDRRQVDRPGQEGMVAIDHQHRLAGRRGQGGRIRQRRAGGEEHRRGPDQVEPLAGRLYQPGQAVPPGLARDAGDRDQPILLQPRQLAGEAVEFAVRGQHPGRPVQRQRRQQAEDEFMGIGGEDQRRRVRQSEVARHMPLGGLPDRAQHLLPLAVQQPRRIFPGGQLRRPGHVRPGMVAMRGEVQPPRPGGQASGEMRPQIQHRPAPLRRFAG